MFGVLSSGEMSRRIPTPPAEKPARKTWPIDKTWKDRVRAELDTRGRGSQEWLAGECHCTPGAITQMLAPKTGTSKLVKLVHRAFGWADPDESAVAVERTDAYRRLMRNWSHLTPEQQAHLAASSELFRAAPKND